MKENGTGNEREICLSQRLTELALAPGDKSSGRRLSLSLLRAAAALPRLRKLILDGNSYWTARCIIFPLPSICLAFSAARVLGLHRHSSAHSTDPRVQSSLLWCRCSRLTWFYNISCDGPCDFCTAATSRQWCRRRSCARSAHPAALHQTSTNAPLSPRPAAR